MRYSYCLAISRPEERVLKDLVALADHDLEASPAQLIDGSEIFGDSNRVE